LDTTGKQQPKTRDLLLEHLKNNSIGAENALSGRRLSSIFGVTSPDVRRIVNTLRSDKQPVCSDSSGYFYASSTQEIDMTIAHLASRTRQMNRAIKGLYSAKSAFQRTTVKGVET